MAIALTDFVNAQTLKPVIAEKIQKYETKAVGFLRNQFGPATRLLNDDQVKTVVQLAFQNAKRRGIVSERDHLSYLIPVMYWGSYFEDDPRFRSRRHVERWNDKTPSKFVQSLIDDVNDWTKKTHSDLHDPARLPVHFQNLYRRPPAEVDEPSIAWFLSDTWPARYAMLDRESVIAFVQQSYGIAQYHNFQGVDGVTYCGLAMMFGYRLVDDPLYPWAASALANDGRPNTERRLALGEAVLNYLDSLDGAES